MRGAVEAAAAPAYGLAVLEALEAAGHEAWFVGGWVRDALRGVAAHDVDVCTSARWQDSERALVAAGMTVHETGVDHGTVTAVVDGRPVEVTTYRVDGAYTDRRHPDSVTFVSDVREDLARRDFTVNAMAWHPVRGLVDPFGGREDLARGVIRAVGEPPVRFGEDALRVLRAVRFACRLGFAIEPATQGALVSAVAAAIAAGDRPSSRLAVRLVARFNPEYRRVALVASSLAAGERPTSALTCVRVFRRDGRIGEETHAS